LATLARVLLRAFVLTFFGLIVCAGLITCFVTLGVFSFIEGPPLETVDFVQGGLFIALSAAVMAVALVASMRTREQGGKGAMATLARIAPLLMLVGAVGGVAAAFSIRGDRARYVRSEVEQACAAPSVFALDAASCPAKAEACLRSAWKQPLPDEGAVAPLHALVASGMKSENDDVARFASSLADDLNRKSQNAGFRKGMFLCLLAGR
jgi:hypothetical protein